MHYATETSGFFISFFFHEFPWEQRTFSRFVFQNRNVSAHNLFFHHSYSINRFLRRPSATGCCGKSTKPFLVIVDFRTCTGRRTPITLYIYRKHKFHFLVCFLERRNLILERCAATLCSFLWDGSIFLSNLYVVL